MKNLFKKYLTQKVRNIISICIIIFGIIYIINYSFYKPTYINKYIAMNIYKEPANNAFTDQNFYNCVIDNYNRDNKTSLAYTENLSDEQLKKITSLNCPERNISNVNGLEKMTSLTSLYFSHNQITSLDVSNNTLLRVLYANNNKLKSLNIDNSLALEKIDVHNNQLIYFEAKNNPSLVYLKLSGNNDLENVNINGAPALKELYFTDGGGFVLNNYAIHCSYKTSIKELDISQNKELEILYLANSKLTSLDISHNSKLKKLGVEYNQLNYLDTSNNPDLDFLDVKYNNLTYFDVSNNLKLEYLNLYHNKLSNVDGLSELLLLKKLAINDNELTNINVSNSIDLSYLTLHENQLTNIDVSENIALIELNISNNQLSNIDINKNTSLTSLNVYNNELMSLDVSKNTSLTSLNVSHNKLTSFDVSKNISLTSLDVYHNELTSLDISNNTALKHLDVSYNKLTNLDVSKNTSLSFFDASNNELSSFDVNNNIKLTNLDVSYNKLTSFDVSKNTSLTSLNIYHNELTNLDVSKNTLLTSLNVYNNELTSLDVSKNTALKQLNVSVNKLTSINLINNTMLNNLSLNNNNFSNSLTKYVGESGDAYNAVKLPSHLEQDITWKSRDEHVAVIDSNGNITTKKAGRVYIVGANKYYTTFTIVNVFEMTSDKYDIDNENLYIYVGNDNNVETIKNNINVPDYVIPNIDLVNNKLKLVSNDEVIKEFKIIRINSNNYKIGSDYIYTRHYSDISGLSCYNCNASIEDNNVIIKYNNMEIDRFKLVKFNNKYTLYCISCSDGAGIYTGMDNDHEIINNLAIMNGNIIIDNNTLKIMYNNLVLEEYDIRGFKTNYKVLENNNIYTGFNEFDFNNVIYRGNKVNGKYNNNVFSVYYNDLVMMGKYNIISLSGNNINVTRKNISTEEIDYNTFINNLGNIDNISYKVIYNNEEVTNGDINPGSILNIYYKDKLIDKYRINSTDTFEIDESVSVIEEKEIINNIEVGFSRDNLFDKINTNGEIFLLDKEGNVIEENTKIKTGYILRTIFDNNLNEPLDYRLSVKGDVLGTGELSRDNAKEIAKHIIDKNVINGDEYLLAADYNNDGKIKMNDVVKILRDKRKQENP